MTTGPRVLYVIDSLDPGGAERSLVDLIPHMTAAGVELTVAVLHDRPGLHDLARAGGAHVVSVAGAGGRPGTVRRLRGLIREHRPSLVHTTLFEADIAGRVAAVMTGTPVVSSLVNVNYTEAQRMRPSMSPRRLAAARVLDLVTARSVRRFHANAEHVATVMGERLRLRPERVEVIPRGRDATVLGRRTPARRAAVRSRLGLTDDDPVLLAVARHEEQKGLDVLLDALPFVDPEVRVLVAGREGNATADLRRRAGALPHVVDLLGAREDVGDLLAAADVFVLPSRWEGFPGAVVEAMAVEAPIVATDLPGVREAVGSGAAAVLVPVDAPATLAAAITEVLEDPVAAAARAAAGRQRFEDRFTIERVAQRMVEFYGRTLGRG